MKNKKVREKRLAIKMTLCLIYLVVITVLFVCSYKLFEEKKAITSFNKAKTIEDYSYIDISKMSERFAYYKDTNIGVHFVIEKEDTGKWHTYLVAINEDEIDKFKDIIDYTYEKTDKEPKKVRVYGYPRITKDKVKTLAIKNIKSFMPKENEIEINNENYESYLTNTYLDTTIDRKDDFNIILFLSLLLLFIVIVILFLTIFDKDKIVDDLDKELTKTKKMLKRNIK